ncbi:hypothetical protein DXG01_006354 [Tephrocybe rancida]|nr:hypothetical protein DXG01_006354 [Tephrocybe rancida]
MKFTKDQMYHYKLFKQLLETQNIPYFKDIIFIVSLERLQEISDMLHKGASGARADDTKGLKGAILEWITLKGQDSLIPLLSRNVKINRGFYHECTGFLLCTTGLQWSDTESLEWRISQPTAFKYIFTSPSSVEKENKAMQSGNARLHNMVKFALSSSSTFSGTDHSTDLEKFYGSILATFVDPDEKEEVDPLLEW